MHQGSQFEYYLKFFDLVRVLNCYYILLRRYENQDCIAKIIDVRYSEIVHMGEQKGSQYSSKRFLEYLELRYKDSIKAGSCNLKVVYIYGSNLDKDTLYLFRENHNLSNVEFDESKYPDYSKYGYKYQNAEFGYSEQSHSLEGVEGKVSLHAYSADNSNNQTLDP